MFFSSNYGLVPWVRYFLGDFPSLQTQSLEEPVICFVFWVLLFKLECMFGTCGGLRYDKVLSKILSYQQMHTKICFSKHQNGRFQKQNESQNIHIAFVCAANVHLVLTQVREGVEKSNSLGLCPK